MIKIILFLFISLLNGQNIIIHPFIKSAILPGWGETSLNSKKRAYTFSFIELSLWTSYLGAYSFSFNQKRQYETFAAEHAGVNINGKNHSYWVDIGNYIDMGQHNAEHLRWRLIDEVYDQEDDKWTWDSKENMKKFETMRINSDMLLKTSEYILGAITLNHILSSIDSLYLSRLKREKEFSFYPLIGIYKNGLQLIIIF